MTPISGRWQARRGCMLQEIALWWRQHGVELGCPLTSEVLRQRDLVGAAVGAMFRDGHGSPYMGLVVRDFLDRMSRDPDPLLSSVAQFELALLRVTQDGEDDEIVVAWDRDPYLALHRLLARLPLDAEPGGT